MLIYFIKGSDGTGLDYSEWIEGIYKNKEKAERELEILKSNTNDKNRDYWIEQAEMDCSS